MSVVTMFANTSESYQQAVQEEIQTIKEHNAPGFNAFRSKVSKRKAGEKGIKIVYDNLISGGHSTPTAARPDWNEPTADEEIASYVYPVRYRLPMFFDHGLIRDYKNKTASAPAAMRRKLKNKLTQALKRLNRAFYGSGDGTLAFSTSNITAVGSSATMNCDTTPATTAGHTKGGVWLKKNCYYHAINASTNEPRGLVLVTAEGKTSVTVTLISGSVSSGDPICDVGTWNGWMRGLAHLISPTNRVVQGVNTADFPDLNSFGIDLAGAPFTFATVEDLCTGIKIRNNDGNKSGKILFATPGQESVVRKSAQNLRVYNDGSNVARGIAEDADFGSNLNVVLDADNDEDRLYAASYSEFGMLEEMELDEMSVDGQSWHMLLGANNAGSDRYQRAIGWDGNVFRRGNANSSGVVYRASVTGVYGQATV